MTAELTATDSQHNGNGSGGDGTTAVPDPTHAGTTATAGLPAADAGTGGDGGQERTLAGIRAAAEPILAGLAATARQREDSRDYAVADVRRLAAAGVTLVGVPAADGGAGGTRRDVADLVIAIARADSNVAQALRSSFLTANQVSGRAEVPNRERTLERLRRGDLFAGTSNERSGGPSGTVNTTIRRDGHGYVLDGEKYYSTGGVYATWFSGTAKDDAGTIYRFTVPLGRDGVEWVDDFDAVGQRLTASGTTRLYGARLGDDEVVRTDGAPPLSPWLGSFAQLYLAAVEAGIAANVLDDAISFARHKARPIKHSTASTSVEDPYVRRVVGEIATRAHAARAAVLLAAETLEEVRHVADDHVRAAGAHAAITVAQAQVVAVESALRAAELLFDVGGATATNRDLGFDRHWRNARTVANHNPREWKQAVVGAYHLAGEEPPTSGLF
jgi:alkylation response protein AidB-like acyl-CoA dehydrogenase